MKQATSTFLTRTQVKKITEKTATVFDPDYPDQMVDKIMKGDSRSQPTQPHEGKLTNARENIVDDWNHIHETVIDLCVPEMADVIGGQMFAGNNLRSVFIFKNLPFSSFK